MSVAAAIPSRKGAHARWRPYAAYRQAPVPWLGPVPEHWLVRRLKYAVRLVNEKTEGLHGLPYVGLEHIESWTGRHIEPDTPIQPDGLSNIFAPNDVLFGKLRPYLAKVLHAQHSGVCTAEALVLRPRLVEPRFLSYYILNRDLISVVDGSTYGSKMPRANWEFIGNLPALIPPLNEQRAIAAFLDRETARIDALIAKKMRLTELLAEKRIAVIGHAVTKGLSTDVLTKPSGVPWLGRVPDNWKVHRLKFAITFQRGHDLPTTDRIAGEVPVVTSAGSSGLHDKAAAQGPGIVTGRYGTIGTFHLIECDYWPLNTTLYSIDLHGNRPRFLWYMLHVLTDVFLVNSAKSAVPGVDRNDLHEVLVAVPPNEEQAAITEHLDEECRKFERLTRRASSVAGASWKTMITAVLKTSRGMVSPRITTPAHTCAVGVALPSRPMLGSSRTKNECPC